MHENTHSPRKLIIYVFIYIYNYIYKYTHISVIAMAHAADPGCECIPFRNAEARIALR